MPGSRSFPDSELECLRTPLWDLSPPLCAPVPLMLTRALRVSVMSLDWRLLQFRSSPDLSGCCPNLHGHGEFGSQAEQPPSWALFFPSSSYPLLSPCSPAQSQPLCHPIVQPAAIRGGVRIKKQLLSLSAQIQSSEQANTQPLYAHPNRVTPFHGVVPSLISAERLLPGGWLHVLLCLFSTQQPQAWCRNASPQRHTMSLLTPLQWHPSPASSLSSPPPPTPTTYTAPLYSTGNSRPEAAAGLWHLLFAVPRVLSPTSQSSLPWSPRFSFRSPPLNLPAWASTSPLNDSSSWFQVSPAPVTCYVFYGPCVLPPVPLGWSHIRTRRLPVVFALFPQHLKSMCDTC